jgi:hypothetical protein
MTSIAKPIKQQILVNLQALVTSGAINSYVALDKNPSPFDPPPPSGYPFAIVGMPRVTSDYEDEATNMVVYRFDVLFVADPNNFKNTDTDLEDLIDAAYSQFAQRSQITLSNTAQASLLPPELVGVPVAVGDKTLVCFVLSLQVRALFSI